MAGRCRRGEFAGAESCVGFGMALEDAHHAGIARQRDGEEQNERQDHEGRDPVPDPVRGSDGLPMVFEVVSRDEPDRADADHNAQTLDFPIRPQREREGHPDQTLAAVVNP